MNSDAVHFCVFLVRFWLFCSFPGSPVVYMGVLQYPAMFCGCQYLLNIWEFVYFVCGLSPPIHHIVRRRNLARRRIATMCRTYAGFYVYRGRRYENNDIFQKCDAVTLGWSVQMQAVGLHQPSGQHAGPLQWRSRRVAIWLAPACLLMQVADISWLAACNCHVQIKPQNQAAAAQQATTACFSHISHAFLQKLNWLSFSWNQFFWCHHITSTSLRLLQRYDWKINV